MTTFNPKWDLHCRNGGVRHWSYTSDDDNHTLQMTEGNVDCVCPDGWEGVECAQCSSDASCSAAGYGASAKCDRTIGVADDAPMSSSCLPIGGTKLFFESITRTKSTFPNVHISRKHGTVRIAVLGETDYPWNSTALVPDPTLYGANSSGFLQNPTSFHMVGSGCSSERRGKCPIAGGHPPGSTCNNLVCPTIRYECPSDCDNDQHGGVTTHCTPTTSRFVNCPAERNLPAGQFSVSVTEMSTNLPPGDDLIVSFKLAALGPFQIACKIGGCRDGSGPTPPTSPPAPAPAPAPVPPAPGAAIDPCSAPALAAHPERAATCSTASYALIFFGPLVATLAVLFSVLLLGGGVKGIGAICTRRCLAPAHLGSGWQEKDADGSGGAAAAGTVPPAAAEEGASLATALLDVTEAPPTISPRRAVPPPTLPAVAERESAGEGGSANAESAAVTLEDEARDFSGASARGIAFRTVACSTGGLLSACKGERAILRGVSGVCRAGELLAVMGPSGCGKTTLLDILSGRKNTGTVSGEVRIDGDVLHSRARRQCTSMVFQDDVLPATSTAAEFLEFHAALRPTHAAVGGESGRTPPTRAEIVAARRARMRRYVAQMDLAKCINTPMGDELTRGLSGGEKRRVSIASALMSSPSVLFLDEPTSGLDSSSAQSVIGALDLVVNDGCAAVFVIHQPPAQLFEHFDRLLLLSGDGRALYSGPRRDVLRYFAQLDGQLAMGGALVCPTDASPPEFLMDLVMLSPPETIDALAREWPNSAIGRHTELLASAAAGTASGGPGGVQGAGGAFRSTSENAVAQCARTQCAPAALATVVPDFLRQVYRLTLRNAIVVVRRPTVLLVHYAATLALAAALAVAFPPFDLGDKKTLNAVLERIGFFFFVLSYFFLASLSVVGIWREERLLFLRERDARCYSAPAYLTSKFLCDTLLLRVVPPSLFAAITYAAVNLRVGPHFAFNFAQLLVATNVGATVRRARCRAAPSTLRRVLIASAVKSMRALRIRYPSAHQRANTRTHAPARTCTHICRLSSSRSPSSPLRSPPRTSSAFSYRSSTCSSVGRSRRRNRSPRP